MGGDPPSPPLKAVAILGLAALGLAALGCDRAGSSPPPPSSVPRAAPPPAPASAPPRREARGPFRKGQLHAHTSGSGDSDTPPEEAAAWYAAHGFDFVVFTDHNHVVEAPSPPGMLVLRGVELSQNLRTCDPPPDPGDACLLHVNALFVSPGPRWIQFEKPASLLRADLYGRAVDRALAMGGIAQLNHPNFQGGASLDVLLALAARGLALVEIANEAEDSTNEGGGARLSTEALWDAALSRGARVWGTATDDAHHYADAATARARGEIAYTGDRGYVMVRAEKTEAGIRAAIAAGDFYASTGALLERVENGRERIEIEARAAPPYRFEAIAGGRVIERAEGTSFRFDPRKAGAGYVRVKVTDVAGRRAWTQPVWL